jgi:DNA-binding NtrC family response regulator
MKTRILVVDDEEHCRTVLGEFLSDSGYEVITAQSGAAALETLGRESEIRVVFTDLSMPGMTGLELIEKAKRLRDDLDFFIVTAHATMETAIKAIRVGAFDYLLKPVEFDEVSLRLKMLLKMRELEKKTSYLEQENQRLRGGATGLAATSPRTRELLEQAGTIAQTNATVLLSGETGVGKDVLANWIHQHSPRQQGPFLAVNCSAIPENLLESEFFGHEKGAFTGAEKRSIGNFERADGGTLFLDEIGEMDLKLQPKLLRAIESRTIRRVGGSQDIEVDVRLITASNRDLKKMVSEGKFREDLLYRLNVVHLKIPPLRERMEDLPELITQLTKKLSQRLNVKVKAVEPSFVEVLSSYSFPGNIRELANIIERSLIYAKDGKLTGKSIPAEWLEPSPPFAPSAASRTPVLGAAGSGEPNGGGASSVDVGTGLGDQLAVFEKQVLSQALQNAGGDVGVAAQALGVSRSTLYAKLSKYGLQGT